MNKQAVIVTGAGGGIGTALCKRLRGDGYLTIGVDQVPAPAADESFTLDLRRTDEVTKFGGAVVDDDYELKAIVHNAAVQPLMSAGQTPVADWLDAFVVNVLAIDLLVGCCRANLAKHGGSIVVIGSVHGRATTTGLNAYATTKSALEGWVRSAALDLGPSIRANVILPGAIDTPKLQEGFTRWGQASSEERRSVLKQRTALRRIGDPAEVAAAASFLIGRDSTFITGSVLVVDGGALARLGSE